MKKNLVKVLTLALAAATVAGMSAMSVSAANTVITDSKWTATSTDAATTKKTITVTSVNDTEAKLTAYQIVKGVYTGGKLSKYVLCDTSTAIADFKAPTATEVLNIAKAINNNTTTLTGIEMTKNGTSFTADVEAGLYIVIATDSDTVVYNPALVAVNITDPNQIAATAVGSSVDMGTYFNVPAKAYLKSSDSGFDKSIVDSSMNKEGDAVAYNDVVKFKLDEMTIPYYTSQYTTVQYKIEDNLEAGSFQGINNLSVVVGGSGATEGTDYTVTYNKAETATAGSSSSSATKFTINFTDTFIRANGGKSVVVTYESKFLDTASLNYAENVNTAKLSYSNDPTDATSVKEITDSTYHYTFGIDAELDAEATTDDPSHSAQDKETFELNKVTDAGETFEEAAAGARGTKRSPKCLDGAEFALYSDAAMTTKPIRTATSDTNGHIRFAGLDTGTYYMKETAAPATYTINTNIYKIVIAATLNEEGIMTQYSIDTYLSTDGGNTYSDTPVGTATYFNTITKESVDKVTGNVTNSISAYDNITPVEIVNTKLAALPATGGEGTIAITIGGAIGMAGFLTLYIANKKKKKAE